MREEIRTLLVTGGAGFIGSEFVRQLAMRRQYKIVVVDALTYAGDVSRLKYVKGKISFYKADIANVSAMESIFKKEKPQAIVHFAAETHVDRSIQDVYPFIRTNITGTQNLIYLSHKYAIKRFIHISTDEVYGDHKTGKFKETDRFAPNNPYAATKTSAELLLRAAIKTYQFPAIIVRPANNYGPWQYPEKFVPVVILKALNGDKIPVYGKGEQIREWLHVSDCARAIYCILTKGKTGESYNIGSYFESKNIDTAKTLLKLLGKSADQIQFVKDRPGHDFRYSVDCSKLYKLGWKPQMTFPKGIKDTIQWSLDNRAWLEAKRKFLIHYWKTVYKS